MKHLLEAIYNFDLSVFNAVFSLHNPVLNTIMTAVTHLGEAGILWIAIAVVLLLFKKTRKIGVTLAFALIVMELLNNEVLKPIIARPRPFYIFNLTDLMADESVFVEAGKASRFEQMVGKITDLIERYPELAAKWASEYKFPGIIDKLTSWSFPSGHTSSAFASATAIFAGNKKWGTAALVFAALMGFTRIYLGVHFCTDVLAGALVGIIYGVIGFFIASGIVKLLKKNEKTAKWFN